MSSMTTIAAALSSFNALKNIAQSMVALHDAQALQAKIIEFNGALIDAQTKIFAVNEERATLIERVHDLEKEIIDLKAWDTEKKRYELKGVAHGGSTAYVIKPEECGTEPPHCICPACYQHAKKSILQPVPNAHAYNRPWQCPECKSALVVALPLPGYAP